jgi:hypothetical protein
MRHDRLGGAGLPVASELCMTGPGRGQVTAARHKGGTR